MIDDIKYYLNILSKMSGTTQADPYAFLLKHGREFQPQARPKNFKRGTSKECFSNSQRILTGFTHKNITYSEGYAIHGDLGIPMHHGWLVDDKGSVIDVTWEHPENSVYFGIAFQDTYVRKQIRDTGWWASLIFNHHNNYELVRGIHKPEDAIRT